jgi:hypothetical protein
MDLEDKSIDEICEKLGKLPPQLVSIENPSTPEERAINAINHYFDIMPKCLVGGQNVTHLLMRHFYRVRLFAKDKILMFGIAYDGQTSFTTVAFTSDHQQIASCIDTSKPDLVGRKPQRPPNTTRMVHGAAPNTIPHGCLAWMTDNATWKKLFPAPGRPMPQP